MSTTAAVQLPATLTMAHASAALRDVEAALAGGGAALHLDASRLDDVDTSAVALLLHARRLAKARGVGFSVSGAPPKLQALAALYGVESLLGETTAGST